jgi:hypothetical protein
MDFKKITRRQAQYAGYSIFVVIFAILGLPWTLSMGFKILYLVPAAFFIGMIGFWIGGKIHRITNENMKN